MLENTPLLGVRKNRIASKLLNKPNLSIGKDIIKDGLGKKMT